MPISNNLAHAIPCLLLGRRPAACPRDPRFSQHLWIPRTSRGTSTFGEKN